jgi:hypothetical protein
MALPTDFTRDIENATKTLYSSWPQFCDRARIAFADKKRGTFLIDVDQPIPNVGDVPYLTTDEASHALSADGPDVAIMSRVGTYNPERELVVTFLSARHGYAQCVVLCDPPDEYKDVAIVTDQPDTSSATTFDQLLDILNENYFRSGVDAMDIPSRHVWRVMEAHWQIQSNGFSGYFYNAGTECCELISALDAINSPILHKVFADAFALFPNGKPSNDADTFYSQLDAITDADEDPFDNHDSAFYEIDEQVPEILWTYWQRQRQQTA